MLFVLIFTYFPFLLFAIVAWTFLRPLKLGRTARFAWTAFLLVCSAKFAAFGRLGGDIFNPELPEALIWVWGWLYSGLVVLCAASVATALVARVVRPDAARLRAFRLRVLPAFAWTVAAVGVFNGIRVPSVRSYELAFEALPSELDGYRIVHLTDLHASSAAEAWRTKAIVNRVNALGADLVCLTGDLVDGPAARGDRIAALAALRAKDGVWAVTGNHEYYHNWSAWKPRYDEIGLKFLENACVFPRPSLALAGVPDVVGARYGEAVPNVVGAFAAATNGEFRLLLEHRPGFARENRAAARVDLQLSGHTHGGIMPLLSSVVRWHNAGFVRGSYPLDDASDARVFVAPGCGQWAGFPVRLFDPAEIALLTLRRKAR